MSQPLKSIAVKTADGTIFTPDSPWAIHFCVREKARGFGYIHGLVDGWVTQEGEFLDRNQAYEYARDVQKLNMAGYEDEELESIIYRRACA